VVLAERRTDVPLAVLQVRGMKLMSDRESIVNRATVIVNRRELEGA
jgi:hypothetical protein